MAIAVVLADEEVSYDGIKMPSVIFLSNKIIFDFLKNRQVHKKNVKNMELVHIPCSVSKRITAAININNENSIYFISAF